MKKLIKNMAKLSLLTVGLCACSNAGVDLAFKGSDILKVSVGDTNFSVNLNSCIAGFDGQFRIPKATLNGKPIPHRTSESRDQFACVYGASLGVAISIASYQFLAESFDNFAPHFMQDIPGYKIEYTPQLYNVDGMSYLPGTILMVDPKVDSDNDGDSDHKYDVLVPLNSCFIESNNEPLYLMRSVLTSTTVPVEALDPLDEWPVDLRTHAIEFKRNICSVYVRVGTRLVQTYPLVENSVKKEVNSRLESMLPAMQRDLFSK